VVYAHSNKRLINQFWLCPTVAVLLLCAAARDPSPAGVAARAWATIICDSSGVFSVSVTPPSGSATWGPNSNGHQASFTVKNTGLCRDTYNFGSSTTGPISGVTLSPASSTLLPGASTTVTATYNVGLAGSGYLTVTATGTTTGVQSSGSYQVNVTSNGPVVSLVPHNGAYRDVTKCVANCFDAVATYTTHPYFSSDAAHSVQLVYRSAQAKPMGMVQVDALDTASINPTKMSISLYTSQSTAVTFTNGSSEMFYTWTSHPADGNVNRLAAEFDASALSTGAYAYTVAVRSYRSNGSFVETDAPVRVLIANEASSPFGAGWSIAGFQHLYAQADRSIVITEGNGSIAWFQFTGCDSVIVGEPQSGDCHYASPKGDFTQLIKMRSADGDGALYYRRYPENAEYKFLSDGRLIIVRDRFVTPVARYDYNASNLLGDIKDTTGAMMSLGYSGTNRLLWIKDPGGRTDSITIDGSGNLTQVKDAAGGLPFVGQYDATHRLVHWADRRAGAWGVTYDFAGKIAADTSPQITANGQAVRPVVNYASVEQKILINPASGQGTSTNPSANVDTAAVRASVTNARGFTTTYALNAFGAGTLTQEPLGRTTAFVRDSNSTLLVQKLPSGHIIRYTWTCIANDPWDPCGPSVTQVRDSTTGRTINYYYQFFDSPYLVAGDIDTVRNVWKTDTILLYGRWWTTGTLDSSRVGGSPTWTKYTYVSGRLCTVVDPGGHSTTCHFTSSSGLWNTDSISNQLGRVAFQYDAHGQQITAIDEVNDTLRMQYDSVGRIVATIGPLRETTQSSYDALYQTQLRDGKGQVYLLWSDALGRPDSTTDPAGKSDHYQYDFNGNVTSWTNRNGKTVQFTYDSLDQVRSVIADGKTTTFFFDPAERYRVAANGESTDTVRLDVAGRDSLALSCRVLATGHAPQCFRDSATYEIRDLRTQIALSAPGLWSTQFLWGYHYDVHMFLDTLTPGRLNTQTGQPITFVYSAEGLDSIRTLTGLNNLTITHSYPWTHRTDQVQLSDPTLTAALGVAYNFDNAGRVATRYHGSIANPDTTRFFAYSPQGSLIWYADSSEHYTSSCTLVCGGYHCINTTQGSFIDSARYVYDSVGNRKDPSTPNGGLDPANRLRRWQSFRMDYDAAGNMSAKRTLSLTDTTKALRTDSLFWSALGRLDSVRTSDSTGTLIGRVGFGYDGLGRRVRKSTTNATSRYLWDGDALLAQLDTLGNTVAGYTYYSGPDNPVTVLRHDRGDSIYYYVQWNPGDVTALLARSSSGASIDNEYRYDPFGSIQGGNSNPIPNSLQFAGREYDAETQLYYNRARYYDPSVGRFISEDPVGLSGGINPYTYVSNNPVNGTDPSGLDACASDIAVEEQFDPNATWDDLCGPADFGAGVDTVMLSPIRVVGTPDPFKWSCNFDADPLCAQTVKQWLAGQATPAANCPGCHFGQVANGRGTMTKQQMKCVGSWYNAFRSAVPLPKVKAGGALTMFLWRFGSAIVGSITSALNTGEKPTAGSTGWDLVTDAWDELVSQVPLLGTGRSLGDAARTCPSAYPH